MINVLSLFDGMSCGQIALERAGKAVDNYYASEVDKYAIQVTQKNYPDTIQLGCVKDVKAKNLSKIDLLIGGSPCQGFSFAGKQLNFDDPRSALFFEYIRLLKELKPKYFLLENVIMDMRCCKIISQELGVTPVMINSALVSAQNRERLYWTNIPGDGGGLFGGEISQPEDKGILLKDILDDELNQVGRIVGRRLNDGKRDDYNKNIPIQQYLEPRLDNKGGCLTTVEKDNVAIIQRPRGNNKGGLRAINGKTPTISANSWEHNNFIIRDKSKCVKSSGRDSYDRHEWDSISDCHYRKLTPIECERLQTVPDNYTNHVSNSQRYKMLGNGWTVDVIVHILKGMIK